MPVVLSMTIDRVDLPKRRHAQVVRESLRQSCVHHVNVTLGKHFQETAYAEYGFNRRNPQYMARKKRQGMSPLPNVRTGKLRRYMRTNSLKRITATQHKSSVFLTSYFNLTPERRREFEALSQADRQTAQRVASEFYAREAAKPENRLKRRRRIT